MYNNDVIQIHSINCLIKSKCKPEHYCEVTVKLQPCLGSAFERAQDNGSFNYKEHDRDISRFSDLGKLWTTDNTLLLTPVR